MSLTQEQVNRIYQRVDDSLIKIRTLKDDVIDHLCCLVEDGISRGVEFETALELAMKEVAPDGLNEIQFQTTILLNFNMIIRMKKLTYAVGLLSSMMMCIGATMNILHLPGAGNLAVVGVGTIGFFAFALLYLPLLALSNFKGAIRRQPWFERTKLIAGCLSGIILGTAVAFKVLHLPGADQFMLTGAALLTFGFLPFVFFSMYKKSLANA
jgi:hypothetical protein